MSRPVKAEQPTTQAPVIDVRTGRLTPYGHRLILALFNRTGGFNDDLADLLVPSLLGEVSALQLADDQARLERIIGDAVTIARASLAEELEGRIRALESPLNLPLALAIARVSETAENLDALIRVLNGTTPFTGLNANGTNVITFLGHTDGSALDDVDGVTSGLITPVNYAFTAGSVSWAASSSEKTLQTVSDVVVTRGAVRISGLVDINIDPMSGASAYVQLKLYRDGVHQANADRYLFCQGYTATWRPASQGVLEYYDTPGAGTYDYELALLPSESITGYAQQRSLACDPQEG